jgi:hypothetical protein
VRAAIRGAKLLGYLTGDSTAPLATILKLGADDKEVMDAAGKVIMIKKILTLKIGTQRTSRF